MDFGKLIKRIPVIVCGTRTFEHGALMPYVLGPTILPILKEIEIIEGDNGGVGTRAALLAQWLNVSHRCFPAETKKYNGSAHIWQHKKIAEYARAKMDRFGLPGYCFAFWDGADTKTENMVMAARIKGLTVTVHEYMPREFYFNSLLQEWSDKLKKAAS